MATITLNRGEATGIPFSITDVNNGLVGKRVTWSVKTPNGVRVLKKAGSLPGSSAQVTIASQVAGTITGTIHVLVGDYASLPAGTYEATLWVDDGTADLCVTPGGVDSLVINPTAPRRP